MYVCVENRRLTHYKSSVAIRFCNAQQCDQSPPPSPPLHQNLATGCCNELGAPEKELNIWKHINMNVYEYAYIYALDVPKQVYVYENVYIHIYEYSEV